MTIIFNSRHIGKPSVTDAVHGAASIFNLSGVTAQEYNFSEDADRDALCNDWEAIGLDLTHSVTQYRRRGNQRVGS